MATKNNTRTIRMSDELLEAINAQIGDTFTQKFEAMVTRCLWELPATEQKLKELKKQILAKRKQLYDMAAQAGKLSSTINNLLPQVRRLEENIARAVHDWAV